MLTVRAFFRHEPTALLGAVWILLWTAVALTSTLWRPDPTPNANDQHLEWSLLPPGAEVNLDADGVAENTLSTCTFWLGTDRFGRDYLSRLVAGSGLSLSVGLVAVLLSLLIGLRTSSASPSPCTATTTSATRRASRSVGG